MKKINEFLLELKQETYKNIVSDSMKRFGVNALSLLSEEDLEKYRQENVTKVSDKERNALLEYIDKRLQEDKMLKEGLLLEGMKVKVSNKESVGYGLKGIIESTSGNLVTVALQNNTKCIALKEDLIKLDEYADMSSMDKSPDYQIWQAHHPDGTSTSIRVPRKDFPVEQIEAQIKKPVIRIDKGEDMSDEYEGASKFKRIHRAHHDSMYDSMTESAIEPLEEGINFSNPRHGQADVWKNGQHNVVIAKKGGKRNDLIKEYEQKKHRIEGFKSLDDEHDVMLTSPKHMSMNEWLMDSQESLEEVSKETAEKYLAAVREHPAKTPEKAIQRFKGSEKAQDIIHKAELKRIAQEFQKGLSEAMSDAQKSKREEIVMGLKKNKEDLKKRYGDRWESVMYAIATSQAMKEDLHESVFIRPIEGGIGKGKIFGDRGTTVDDHLSAMRYHGKKYHDFKQMGDDQMMNHHGKLYHAHKDQIESMGGEGNPFKD